MIECENGASDHGGDRGMRPEIAGLSRTRSAGAQDDAVSQVIKVFAITRSDSSDPLRDLINKNSDRVIHTTAAVDDTESVQRAAIDVEAILGTQGLDVLVKNAGTSSFSPGGTKSVPPEQLAHVFDVNVIGPQRMIAAFLPLLEMGKQKKVINVYVLNLEAAPRLEDSISSQLIVAGFDF